MRALVALVLALAACDSAPSADAGVDLATGDDGAITDAAAGDDLAPDGGGGPACPPGTTLVARLDACGVAPAAPATLTGATATRGDVVDLGGLSIATVPCAPTAVCAPDDAPTLVFSDEPESPTGSGVLYADTVGPGRVRVYVYHANGGATPRRFSVVALNSGAQAVTATIGPRGLAGPTTAYVGGGRAAALAWLTDTATRSVAIAAGTRVVLDPTLDGLLAQPGELVHAIVDVTLDGPVKLSVVTVGAGVDTATATAGLPLLASTGAHVRGTFARAERLLVVSPTAFARLRLGTGATEPLLTGRSAVDNRDVTLAGSYGLLYRLDLRPPGRLALLLAPRGGAWAGAARLPDGDDAVAGALALPTAPTSGLSDPSQAIAAGRYPGPLAAALLTGGGSSLPLDLLLVPLP